MRKSQTTAFILLLFYIGKLIFCYKIYLKKISLYCYIRTTCQFIGNAVTPMLIQIFIGFVDAIPRSKALGNRLGILTQMLIAMDYFFYLYISDKYLQFREKKYINLGNQFHYKKYDKRDRSISKTFVFIYHHSIQHEASGYTFCKEKKHLLVNIFGSPYTRNQIYFLRTVFQTLYTSKICT